MEGNFSCRTRLVGCAGVVFLLLCAIGCVQPRDVDTSAKVEKMPAMSKELTNLKQKYEGRIVTGMTDDYLPYAKAMEELLAEWDPVGLTAEEVQYVIGASPEVRKGEEYAFIRGDADKVFSYPFESGYSGVGWLFFLKEGVVVAVERASIE